MTGDVRRVLAARGELTLETVNGTLVLALGEAAELWARNIAAPPSRSQKLGIAPGQRVSEARLSSELRRPSDRDGR